MASRTCPDCGGSGYTDLPGVMPGSQKDATPCGRCGGSGDSGDGDDNNSGCSVILIILVMVAIWVIFSLYIYLSAFP